MANETIVIHKGRVNVIAVSLGMDVSGDTLTSEIRTAAGELVAPWVVSFDGDGTNGEIILTMDDSVSAAIVYERGLMDIKRVSASQPYAVFDMPFDVEIRETVTV